jgi:hypothetical protein
MRLLWSEFISWVDKNHEDKATEIKSLIDQTKDLLGEINQQNFDVLQSRLFYVVVSMWK